MALLAREESMLLVIDAQDGFYGPSRADVDRDAFADALARAAWLVGVAAALGVPVVATEEDPERNGATAPSILARLPPTALVVPKAVFGAAHDPLALPAIHAARRPTVVICGGETDVCVAHTALGLAAAGYRPVAVRDALFSATGAAHGHGLARLGANGIELLSAKEVYYDWVRTLEAARRFEDDHPELADPPGFAL